MDTRSEDKIILIDKPAGISSFGVVAKVRGRLKTEFGHKVKVGHTGTLDPFATGLLILLSGKMTKKSNEFLKKDKVYEATLKLGYTSTTGDPEGEIQLYPGEGGPEPGKARISAPRPWQTAPWDAEGPKDLRAEATRPELDIIESVISSFIGEIEQTPPRFSAIKINGERAYKLARKGTDFEIPKRKVTIYSIEILDYNYPELKIRTHVSSGTYIRTLAEDIGKKLGTGAYLTALRRTKIADYDVKDAEKLVL
ncbi:tRNA pseudouridine(55) synthase TruB [Candidatus Saccharibacteria bacterium]|nr:tRNA pseudouridine(55) synthase TruB [Candidatus Saccharibacteria bacterium]